MTERWLNVDEIAQHLGIAPITIYRWLEKGGIPSHRVGKLWRFKASEVDSRVGTGGAEMGSDKEIRFAELGKNSTTPNIERISEKLS